MAEPKRPKPGQHSVLLLHGILGQEFVYWNLLKRYLRGDRFHFHESRMPFFGFGDLRKSAAHLAQRVDQLLSEAPQETSDGRIDIIAHSAGGLAARYYIKYLGGDAKVHHLITLGTPHHGTYFSYTFPVATVVRQTLPGSSFLQELNKGGEAPPPVEYTSIYTPTDGIVLPPESAMLDGAENIKVAGTTHWGFLWRPKVYQVIREVLDHTPRTFSRKLVRERRRSRPKRK